MVTDFYISLIYKELEGTIKATEQTELDNWCSKENHSEIKAQIVSIWNLSEDVSSNVGIDMDGDFTAIQSKIQQDVKVVAMKPKSRSWISIAAGIAILVAAIFAVQRFTKVSSELVSHTAMNSDQYYMLEDGSEIYLKIGSTISYVQPLNKNRRAINLDGEAVFHVAHDKNWPLDVNTSNEIITVLGTKFHVLEEVNSTTIQLMEGRIAVADKAGQSLGELTRGQSLIHDFVNKKHDINYNLNENDFYWQSKQLRFESVKLGQVAKDLEEVYGVQIDIENETTKSCLLSARFKEKTLNQIMNAISKIHNIEIQKEGNRIIWKGGQCK